MAYFEKIISWIQGATGVALDAVLGGTKPANVLQVGGNDGTNAYAIPLASGGVSVAVKDSTAEGYLSTLAATFTAGSPAYIQGTVSIGSSTLPTTGSTLRTNASTSSSGWTSIIAAGGGSETVRLWRLVVSASAATNIEIGDGTNVFLGPYYLTADGSITLDFSGEPWCITGPNAALEINNSASAVAITFTTWTTQS